MNQTQTAIEAPRVHVLKTDPEVFAAVLAGLKTHEIRLNDRNFAVGDLLELYETVFPGAEMKAGAELLYTGRTAKRTVSHIQTGYGLADGWCILSFAAIAAPAPAQSSVDDLLNDLRDLVDLTTHQRAVVDSAIARIAASAQGSVDGWAKTGTEDIDLVIARLEQIAGNFSADYRNDAGEALVCALAVRAHIAQRAAIQPAGEGLRIAIERRLPSIWNDANAEWGDAVGGPQAHEIFANRILSAILEEIDAALIADEAPAGPVQGEAVWQVYCRVYGMEPQNIDYDGVQWSAFLAGYTAASPPPQVVAPSDKDDPYQVIVDRRDLFDTIRAAWRDGQDHSGEMDEAERWHKSTDHADKAIKAWSTMRPAAPVPQAVAPEQSVRAQALDKVEDLIAAKRAEFHYDGLTHSTLTLLSAEVRALIGEGNFAQPAIPEQSVRAQAIQACAEACERVASRAYCARKNGEEVGAISCADAIRALISKEAK